MIKGFILFTIGYLIPYLSFSQQFLPTEPPASETQIFNDLKKYGFNHDGSLRVEVNGSPFWIDEWCKGQLFDFRDSSYGFYSVKIDLAQEAVYFINRRGKEMEVNEGQVKKVIFYDSTDKNKIRTVFRINVPEVNSIIKQKSSLVQEMNQGNYKLLKLVNRQIESADSMFGTLKRYFYKDRNEFFIEKGNRIEKIKKLGQDEILAQLPTSSKYTAWIKEHKLNFKKERDIVLLLDYYNSQRNE
jgi:hypothetical protein